MSKNRKLIKDGKAKSERLGWTSIKDDKPIDLHKFAGKGKKVVFNTTDTIRCVLVP